MNTTLILLKPDCVTKGLCGAVIRRFEAAGFSLRGVKMLAMTNELVREHYAHIADKPFFPEVVDFMQSSPVVAIALDGENVIDKVRDLLGPTDSTKAEPGTIRGDHGVDVMVNVAHASDSAESAAAELARFFQPDELFDPAPRA